MLVRRSFLYRQPCLTPLQNKQNEKILICLCFLPTIHVNCLSCPITSFVIEILTLAPNRTAIAQKSLRTTLIPLWSYPPWGSIQLPNLRNGDTHPCRFYIFHTGVTTATKFSTLHKPSNPMNPPEYLYKLFHSQKNFHHHLKTMGYASCLNFSTSVPSGSVHPVHSCHFVLVDTIQKKIVSLVIQYSFSCAFIWCRQSNKKKKEITVPSEKKKTFNVM